MNIQIDRGTVSVQTTSGSSISLNESGEIAISSPAALKINANSVDISASQLTVNAGMTSFSGVVKCDTLITNSVVSASYTPGAGNLF